jgi:hypothetical protein
MIRTASVPRVMFVLLLQALAAVDVEQRDDEEHNRHGYENYIAHKSSSVGDLRPVDSVAGSLSKRDISGCVVRNP